MYKKLFSLSKILLAHNFHTRWNIKHKHEDYGNTCNGVFKGGIQHLKDFWLKINCQVKSLNFANGEVSKSAEINFLRQKSSESF